MIQLLWTLINISLLLVFFVICFKATKLLREKTGLFAAIIFVFGLLSFVSDSNNDNNKEPNANQIKTWKFNSRDSLNLNKTYTLQVELETTLASNKVLGITIRQQGVGENYIPISAYSTLTGLTGGITWIPSSIIVKKTTNHEIQYDVTGIVKWSLLGATFYTENKEYHGKKLIKHGNF